jgi:hypothetical protein
MLGFYRAVAKQRAYLLRPGRIGCKGENTFRTMANDVAAPVSAMGVNDPTPTIARNGTAIATGPAGCTELVSDDFPVFHWRHDARISESRATSSNDHRDSALSRRLGVQPYWTGEHAKDDAIGYAIARAKFGRGGKIRVLKLRWQSPDNYPLNKSPDTHEA